MKTENPNKKGVLGEISVCKELCKLGYDVFIEFGNHSKVDLIVLDADFKTYKIQVKAVNSTNGYVTVYSNKTCLNPKYNSIYTTKQIDIFAIFVVDLDFIFYVAAKEILKNGKCSKFRISESKNGQKKHVRYAEDYMDFKKALRDCTPHTQTDHAAGDETVQTTTFVIQAAGENQCGK